MGKTYWFVRCPLTTIFFTFFWQNFCLFFFFFFFWVVYVHFCPLLSSSIGTIWCLFWLFYWQLFMYLTNTQRYLLTFFIQASKRCLLTFSIFHFPYSLLKGKKKKNIFHTYMVFVRCTWHPLIPTHTFVKAHLWAYSLFMYLTKSTKRCLLAFFIQFTKKKKKKHFPYIRGFCWVHVTPLDSNTHICQSTFMSLFQKSENY